MTSHHIQDTHCKIDVWPRQQREHELCDHAGRTGSVMPDEADWLKLLPLMPGVWVKVGGGLSHFDSYRVWQTLVS